MKKATVTYTAPAGEAKTLEIGGTLLMTGKPDTIICDDHMMDRMVAASTKGSMLKVENVTDYDTDDSPPKESEPGKQKGKAA